MKPHGQEKLPKRWQDYITSLENRVDRLTSAVDGALGVADDKTLIRIVGSPGLGGSPDRPLPEHTTIRFKTGPSYEDFIDVHMGRTLTGGLLPYITIRAGYELLINPGASNTAHAYAGNPYMAGALALKERREAKLRQQG